MAGRILDSSNDISSLSLTGDFILFALFPPPRTPVGNGEYPVVVIPKTLYSIIPTPPYNVTLNGQLNLRAVGNPFGPIRAVIALGEC